MSKQYPLHLVCAWIGNSPDVARDHYLQILDGDFLAAAGLTTKTDTEKTGAKSGAAQAGMPSQRAAPYFGKPSVNDLIAGTKDDVQVDTKVCELPGMGAVGLEQSQNIPDFSMIHNPRAPECAPLPADLRFVIAAWPSLPDELKRSIIQSIRRAGASC